MSITIAAPGPSLFKSASRKLTHVDIAINFAIKFIRCDWLVCHDPLALPWRPGVGILTLPNSVDYWRNKAPALTVCNAGMYDKHAYFSSETAISHAIALARERNETSIEIHGMDLCGSVYCDGSPLNIGDESFLSMHMNTEEALAERWKRERDAVGHAIQRATDHGLAVVLHP